MEKYRLYDQKMINVYRAYQSVLSFYIEDVYFEKNSLKIILCCDSKKYSISFDDCVSFRYNDEGDRLKTQMEQEGIGFDYKIGIYCVENSEYVKSIVRGVNGNDSLQQYSIITYNDIVDVISENEPVIARFRK